MKNQQKWPSITQKSNILNQLTALIQVLGLKRKKSIY